MRLIKNTAVGFLVSFAGSVPLGYLNIAGYEIFSAKGWSALLPYVLGVVTVEVLIIYGTLVFADKLASKKQLIRGIEIFSILFMLALAVVFLLKTGHANGDDVFFRKYFNHSAFVIGVILSSLNFMQLPFWVAWNLYVVNNNYIRTSGHLKIFYVLGTLIGSFTAIVLIAVGLDYAGRSAYLSEHIMPYLFPVVFLLIAIYQMTLYYRKYHWHK